jgi:DNA-binding response OmpR family regulator
MGRILIIEDEVDQAELYRMALENAGHEVVGIAEDFRPAQAKVRAPDVVILDERLGARSGSALIPRIRTAFPEARILILTADPDVADQARTIGADDGKMKPLPLAQLLAHVREMLARAT